MSKLTFGRMTCAEPSPAQRGSTSEEPTAAVDVCRGVSPSQEPNPTSIAVLDEKCFAPFAMNANVTMRDNKHAFICSSLGNLMDLVLLSCTLPDSAAWSMDEKWALIAAGCLGA